MVEEGTRGGGDLSGEKSALVETFTQFADAALILHSLINL